MTHDNKRGYVGLKTAIMLMALAVFNPFLLVQVQAQDEGDTWQHYYEMWMGDEEVENEMAETLYDELAELSAHKINLNTATRADLQRMAFLTDKQINDIGEYVYRYGPVQSVAELSMVPTLDLATLRLIQCFVYAGEGPRRAPLPPLDTLLHHTRSELTAAFRAPLYNRDGDLLGAKRGYLGPKYRHWLRFKTGYGRKLEVGLTAAQDAGEPFFTQQNRWGYDFYSFYAIMRNVGRIKTAVVGRYRARLGMGLILNTDFTLGKAMALGTLGRTENRLRAHSSRQESPYLQGAAATIQLTNTLELTTLFSIRNVDATLNADGETVKTLLKTGYHRTESEMQRRRNTQQTVGAASVAWTKNGFRISASALTMGYNRQLQPDTDTPYKRYYPQGKHFSYAALGYSWMGPKLQVAGETATSADGGWAALHTVSYEPWSALTLTAVHRYYAYRYHALMGSAFGTNRDTSNEHGLYLGAQLMLSGHATLSAYTDWAQSAWPRYGISFASHSSDHQLSLRLAYPSFTFNASYRLRAQQHDNAQHDALDNRFTQRLKLAATLSRGIWHASTQLHGSAYTSGADHSLGFLAMQNLGLTHQWLTADAALTYFCTDDYDSRLYVYERGLLYDFSFPMFYGRGIHYSARLRADLSPRLMLMAKAATTNYFDRSAIGSGLQRIGCSSKTDVEVQLRWKF